MAISKIITSSLTDDAVTSAKIGTDQVGADALSSSAISGAVDIPANSVGQSELSIDLSAQSVPHIIPGVLYPGYDDKQIDGTTALAASTTGPGGSTVTSSKYGTVQSDGRMYYYTDIKGSKPIKDPRIGGHFGSQRHKFKSLQLLEQETAKHGKNVYSVDGREWLRAVEENSLDINYDAHGNLIALKDEDYVEIVGYFNDANFATYTYSGSVFGYKIDGGSFTSFSGAGTSVNTPLASRYVDAASFVNLGLSVSLGIHTLRLKYDAAGTSKIYAVDLIAQDTSNRNNIQIPSQNVVSQGKKFNVSGTPHYDPFTTMSYGGSGTTLSALQSLIDTDTSLGMDAWKAGTSNYHRPWNGGRVIKWVDSSGTIKTSVNMMPPNAQNIGTTASNAVSDAHVIAGTNDDTINFNTSAIDHSQAEVAKTFHFREFGNGAANSAGGGGTSNTYADASMLSTTDNIAYVMDDGLTSLSAYQVAYGGTQTGIKDRLMMGTGDYTYITFIGTGITFDGTVWADNAMTTHQVAQNLPYGTHILKVFQNSGDVEFHIGGVKVYDSTNGPGHTIADITFHQPKKPPIPEDACVLADYMLMADYVKQTDCEATEISKGVRYVSGTRDHFIDSSSAFTNNVILESGAQFGLAGFQSSSTNDHSHATLHFFGTTGQSLVEASNASHTVNLPAGTATTETALDSTDNENDQITIAESVALGQTSIKTIMKGSYRFYGHHVVTPIHTSHHYQTFETPFLHELVGGDRNMEQMNLVCSPDGKTWDQITRDTSYIGKILVSARVDIANGYLYDDLATQWDEWRGGTEVLRCQNKDWAIAFDRIICLKDGEYTVVAHILHPDGNHSQLRINGVTVSYLHDTGGHDSGEMTVSYHFKRGDYVQTFDYVYNGVWSHIQILKN